MQTLICEAAVLLTLHLHLSCNVLLQVAVHLLLQLQLHQVWGS